MYSVFVKVPVTYQKKEKLNMNTKVINMHRSCRRIFLKINSNLQKLFLTHPSYFPILHQYVFVMDPTLVLKKYLFSTGKRRSDYTGNYLILRTIFMRSKNTLF